MPAGGINGIALGTAAVGGLFLYAAITNKSVIKTLQNVVTGESPAKAPSKPSVVDTTNYDNTSDLGTAADSSGTGFDTQVSGAGAPAMEAFLKRKTTNKAMIAGIMGNAQVESSFKPTALNGNEGAIGYFQWEGGRRTALQSYARSHGGKETDSAVQLNFMWHELTTSFPLVYASMKVQTSPEHAAAIFDAQYEISAGSSRNLRETAARSWYERI